MNDKASVIIRLAQEHLGDPYVYGAWGSPCTPGLRRKYARLNPSHAGNITKKCQVLNGGGTSCAGCKWQGALAYDCRGFTHWLLKQVGIEIAGGGATSQYNTIANWAVRGKNRGYAGCGLLPVPAEREQDGAYRDAHRRRAGHPLQCGCADRQHRAGLDALCCAGRAVLGGRNRESGANQR